MPVNQQSLGVWGLGRGLWTVRSFWVHLGSPGTSDLTPSPVLTEAQAPLPWYTPLSRHTQCGRGLSAGWRPLLFRVSGDRGECGGLLQQWCSPGGAWDWHVAGGLGPAWALSSKSSDPRWVPLGGLFRRPGSARKGYLWFQLLPDSPAISDSRCPWLLWLSLLRLSDSSCPLAPPGDPDPSSCCSNSWPESPPRSIHSGCKGKASGLLWGQLRFLGTWVWSWWLWVCKVGPGTWDAAQGGASHSLLT